jgi:hypothetical protein
MGITSSGRVPAGFLSVLCRTGGENEAVEQGAGGGPARLAVLAGRAAELGEVEGFLAPGAAGRTGHLARQPARCGRPP